MFIRLIVILTIAITQTTITPTPAPTKTREVPTTATSARTPEATPQQESRTLTQENLNIITGNVQRPNGIVWLNGQLYVACTGDWTLYEINDTTGDTRTYIYGIRNSHSMYVDEPTENSNQVRLWVPDFETNTLYEVSNVQSPRPVARNLGNPWGIAYLDTDHFLVTSLRNNSISTISRQGVVTEIVSELRSPTGIAMVNEFVYFANSGSARRAIEWFKTEDITHNEDQNRIQPEPLVSGIQNVTNVTAGQDGKLYFAYSLGTRGVVGRIDPANCRDKGGCSNDEVEIVLYTDLTAPLAGLTITPDMRLFVHTMFRPEIYWVQLP